MIGSDQLNKPSGFTLIELVVAIGILLVIISISASLFSNFINLQNIQISDQETQEDLRLALELFNREARTAFGSTYEAGSGSTVSFRNQNGDCVLYLFEGGSFKRAAQPNPALDLSCSDPSVYELAPVSITDSQTPLQDIVFTVSPAERQDSVLLSQGIIRVLMILPDYTLQSTATSRQVLPFNVSNDV